MICFKNEKGGLLIEILMGMSIMIVVFSVVVPVLTAELNITSNAMVNNDLLQEGRWAMDLMTRDISGGYQISVPTANSLVLSRWDTASDITYSVINNELCRQIGSGTAYPITDGNRTSISSTGITFTSSTNRENVTINVTITKQDTKNTTHTQTFKSTVFLYNNNAGIGGN